MVSYVYVSLTRIINSFSSWQGEGVYQRPIWAHTSRALAELSQMRTPAVEVVAVEVVAEAEVEAGADLGAKLLSLQTPHS